MLCPLCAGPMTAVGKFWTCGDCGHSQPAAPERVRSPGLAALVPQLPATVASVLAESNRQLDASHALHSLCGALEITARFLTAVALADVRARRAFPEPLVKQLLQHLERPTLASWRVLLAAAVEALPGPADG